MSDQQRIVLQKAFIIHRRDYRETSVLIDVLSRDHGKVALIARGVRGKKAKWSSLLQPFNPLRLSWSGRSDLQTLTAAEWHPPVLHLTGTALYCGLYMNELLNRFLHRHDPHPDLFSFYAGSLKALSEDTHIERTLRFFETTLLHEVGYGLQLDYEVRYGKKIEANKYYVYILDRGPVEAAASDDTIHGATLIGLRQKYLNNRVALSEAKRLLRQLIDHHLGAKPLRSRAVFKARKQLTHG